MSTIITKETIQRLLKDVKQIMKNPLTDQGIYYIHDDEDMLKGYALIIGPSDTPYFGGNYFFEFNYPADYPHSPPKLKYCTNGNNVRFNPNLYVCGKVCVSLFENFQLYKKKNVFTVTDKRMTRFNITLQQGVKVVMDALLINKGGEIFVPKCQSYNILDLVKAINLKGKIKVIGIRAGEKIHEELITTSDSLKTIESEDGFIILNDINKKIFNYYKKKGYKKVKDGFSYNSLENKDYLTVNQIAQLINKNKDKLDC
jgi:ubiquitin-protein ligase